MSIGRLHGDEVFSENGIREATEYAEKHKPTNVKYVSVPQVNPFNERDYRFNSIKFDLNRKWPDRNEKLDTKSFPDRMLDLAELFKTKAPILVVDHHDGLECYDKFFVNMSSNYSTRLSKMAKELVYHICDSNKLLRAENDNHISMWGSSLPTAKKISRGVYSNIVDCGMMIDHCGNGMVLEVGGAEITRQQAVEIHKKCDLFLLSCLS